MPRVLSPFEQQFIFFPSSVLFKSKGPFIKMYAFRTHPHRKRAAGRAAFAPRSRNERRRGGNEAPTAEDGARLCNTFAQEVGSVEQNGEG